MFLYQKITSSSIVALVLYLLYRIALKLLHEHRINQKFKKLPNLPCLGKLTGLLIGNADLYYHTMRHLTGEQAMLQTISGMNAIDCIRRRGLTRFTLGFQRFVSFYRADTVESLMNSVTNITKGEQYMFLKSWLGFGLLTSTGDMWKNRRKLLTPAFHFKILESFLPIMNKNAQLMMDRIEDALGDTKCIDIRHLITNMTLDTICETAMGTTVGAQGDKAEALNYITPLHAVISEFSERILNPLLHSDFIYNMSSNGREFNKNISQVQQFIRRIIVKRREKMKQVMREQFDGNGSRENAMENEFSRKRHVFLDSLLVTHFQRPEQFTEKDIQDEVNTFMFGGHDTVSQALTFALLLIAESKRVQDKVYKELSTVVDSGNHITLEDCRQLNYLEMCIRETMRLYPPAPVIARKIEHDFTAGKYLIPAGTTAVIMIYLLHRDPKVFPQPERFIPERFEPGAPVHKMPHAYMPFSAGPRNCIGQKFAMPQMKIVLATILRKYRLRAVTKRDQVQMAVSVVLKPITPVMIGFEKRNLINN